MKKASKAGGAKAGKKPAEKDRAKAVLEEKILRMARRANIVKKATVVQSE